MTTTRINWNSYGQARLVPVVPVHTNLRTADANGRIGAHPIYARFASEQRFSPPYTWSGRMMVRERLEDPYIKSEQRRPTWDWAVTFHPMHDSNDENVFFAIGDKRQTKVRVSAESIVEGVHSYRYRTDLVKRTAAKQIDPVDGRWHDFRCEVLSYSEYKLFWDDKEIVHVIEAHPTTIGKPTQVALRLDFFDVEISDVKVTEPSEPAGSFDNDEHPNYSSGPVPTPRPDGTMPFDFSRYDWYPDGLGGPAQVSMSNGKPRPPLRPPLDTFGVHFGGAGTQWLDSGDTIEELRGIELNWARPQNKPNEYNSANDIDSQTWEYAGPFRAAHSSGNNDNVWGHLVLYGLERLTEGQAQALIAGIRRARAQCVAAGYLTADHEVKGHRELRGASTGCPGPLYTNKRWWGQIVASLTSEPTEDLPQLPTEENDMPTLFLTDPVLGGTFALCAGRWVPWLGNTGRLPHIEHVTKDHPWTRAQILFDQGPLGQAAWVKHSGRSLKSLTTPLG
jgi:hypothetical protein